MISHDFVPSPPLSSTTEGPKIGNVGFRPTTPLSARLSTAMRLALSVFASGRFSAEKPGRGRPNRTIRTSPLESRNFSIFQISSNDIPFDAESAGDAGGTLRYCCQAVLGRKTGAGRGRNVPKCTYESSRERKFFQFFRFRPTTSHSTGISVGDACGALRFGRRSLLRRIGEASSPTKAKTCEPFCRFYSGIRISHLGSIDRLHACSQLSWLVPEVSSRIDRSIACPRSVSLDRSIRSQIRPTQASREALVSHRLNPESPFFSAPGTGTYSRVRSRSW
jgi:hypothetical protein